MSGLIWRSFLWLVHHWLRYLSFERIPEDLIVTTTQHYLCCNLICTVCTNIKYTLGKKGNYSKLWRLDQKYFASQSSLIILQYDWPIKVLCINTYTRTHAECRPGVPKIIWYGMKDIKLKTYSASADFAMWVHLCRVAYGDWTWKKIKISQITYPVVWQFSPNIWTASYNESMKIDSGICTDATALLALHCQLNAD